MYLQVSLYISSGVCGKGSVFFFEPGLERCLLALQSNAETEFTLLNDSTTFEILMRHSVWWVLERFDVDRALPQSIVLIKKIGTWTLTLLLLWPAR